MYLVPVYQVPVYQVPVYQVPVYQVPVYQVYQEDQNQISGATYISDVVFIAEL